MPTHQLSNMLEVVDKRNVAKTSTADNIATPANFADNDSLDTRLLAIGGYYTAANIQKLTLNDKIWAVRSVDEAAGI